MLWDPHAWSLDSVLSPACRVCERCLDQVQGTELGQAETPKLHAQEDIIYHDSYQVIFGGRTYSCEFRCIAVPRHPP